MLNFEEKFFKHLNGTEYKNIHNLNWYVAISGGVDSLALLHLISSCFKDKNITAIYIDHGIHQDSQKWQTHCQQICEKIGISFIPYQIKLKSESNKSFETKARELRYKAFKKIIPKKSCLFTAHHKDDQVETFLFRLFRGSSFKGLAGIKEHSFLKKTKIHLKRPLISFCSKKEIVEYADEKGFKWINDPSNLDTKIKRNLIRKNIIPKINQIHPNALNTLLRHIEKSKQVDELFIEIANDDIKKCLVDKEIGSYLSIARLKTLSKTRLLNLIYQFAYQNWNFYFEGSLSLENFIDKFIYQSNNCDEFLLKKIRFINDGDLIIALKNNKIMHKPKKNESILNKLNIEISQGKLSYEFAKKNEWGFDIECINNLETIDVGGLNRVQLAGKNHHQSLKKLFQEYNIAFYLRDFYPYLSLNNQLVALPNIGICDSKYAKKQIDEANPRVIKFIWNYL